MGHRGGNIIRERIMNYIALIGFLVANVVAVRRPGFALALVISMFAVKQLVQAGNPWLALTAEGSFVINAMVLASAAGAIAFRIAKRGRDPIQAANIPWAATVLLFAWSAVTCLWSPVTDPFSAVTVGIPYFVLGVIVAPFLARDWDDVVQFQESILWIGIPTAAMILMSPDFTMKYGRLGLDIGASRSNPLALGEFGGLLVIAAATLRRPGAALLLARTLALLLGTALAIRSGSRGQFLYAVAIAMAFYPLAAPIRNPRTVAATIIGLLVIGFAAAQLLELLLEDPFEAKRFSLEEIVYGKSSAAGRVTNVLTLAKAWASNPIAPIAGLGLGAFAYYSESAGEPYSHVLFADAVFELGLPGAVLMFVIVWTSAVAAFGAMRRGRGQAATQAAAAMVVGWWLYEILLVNKQGALWGVASLFPAAAIMARLVDRGSEEPTTEPPAEGTGPAEHPGPDAGFTDASSLRPSET
jgi:hypothetical protein